MYSKDFRILALRLYKQWNNYRKVCSTLNISLSTLNRWRCKGIEFVKRRPFSVPNRIEIIIVTMIAKNPFLTAIDVVKSLHTQGISRCSKTIYNYFKKLLISKKKAYHVCSQRYNPEKERIFKETMKECVSDNLISLDECYFSEKVLPHYGYAKKGCRIKTGLLPPEWQKRSLLLAVSSAGEYNYEIYEGSVNKLMFESFVQSMNPKEGDKVLLDNVAFHHGIECPHFIFTPPYQPMYNPVEYCFSKIKHAFRQMAMSSLSVEDKIHKAIQSLTPYDITHCFQHVTKLLT